nr:hypothetical protein [Tanacetum cinerariifolium]
MTSLTSMCELACQIVQKKLEEKQLEEEQAAKAQNWKLPICYDDDNDDDEESSNSLKDNIISELPLYSAVIPSEPVDSLNMGDEHLNTIPAMKSDEFIKSCVENLVPNPSESEGKNKCDVPAGFTTFPNVLFDADYDFDSGDDQSFSDEDFLKKSYSNPLFDEEINPMKIDQHSFNAESDLIESMPNHDSLIIISSKIDSLFDEFTSELTLLKSIPLGIDETDCHHEKETNFAKRLLYDNISPRPPEEVVSDNSNADIESFSPSPIPNKDSDSHVEEIDLPFTSNDPMPLGIKDDDYDSGRDILILKELLDNYSLLLPANDELTLLKSIPLGIDETDCHPEKETHFAKRLLYDNISPRPPEEVVSDNSNADIESFSPSAIPNKDSDSHVEEIDLPFTSNDPMPLGIKDDDYDSGRDILILKELLDNYSLLLPANESYHFDIPSPYRPPAKPPDGNTGTLNIKMMGDVSDQKVPIPGLTITRILNQEKSPDLLSHHGLEAFQPFAECPMIINGKNIPLLDVPLFHFYPP